MKNMKTKIIFFTVVSSLIASSCGENVLDRQSTTNVKTENYYKTVDELNSSLTGSYAILQGTDLGGREYFFLHDLRSDDVASGGGQLETARNQILIGSLGSTNSVMTSVWNGFYRLIHRTNAIIESAPAATGDAGVKARIVGEARFLRAWAYFQLAAFWGDVPLYDTYAKSFDDVKPRSPQSEVFNFVISELNSLQADLPVSYSGNDLGRASRGAALTLLGKVYIFMGDYTNAKTQFEAVKGMGYALVDKYFDNFKEETEYNKESIFELSYTSSGNFNWDADGNGTSVNESWIRSQEYSAVGWRNLIPSDKLLNEYEANDPRLKDNFYFIGNYYGNFPDSVELTAAKVQGNSSNFHGVTQKISWKKYSVMYKIDPGGYYDKIGINYRMYRYADVLLMLAECENEVGTGAAAMDYMNMIRNRKSVSMPNYPTADFPCNSKAEITRAIIHERQVELGGEEVRNFDILRWRKNGKLATEPISYFEANKFELLPIPQDEINTNKDIPQSEQNPGY